MSADRSLQAYLQEAASWDSDRVAHVQRHARIAWRVAAGACLCVFGLSSALVVLIPLKSVEPFLIRVSSGTGQVEVVPVYRGGEDFPAAIARYFLIRYVEACERFDYAMAERDYAECGSFNSHRLNEALYHRWMRGNPRSPLNEYRDGGTVAVRIEAVSLLGSRSADGQLAQVRFERVTRQADGARERTAHWIETVRYRFSGPPRSAAVRQLNPLGFEITALERRREMLHGVDHVAAAKAGS